MNRFASATVLVAGAVIQWASAEEPSTGEVQETMQNIKKLQGNDLGDELFVLATNFLLYIALVILTMLLQKMYFPHTIPDDDAPETVVADEEDEEKRVEMAPLRGQEEKAPENVAPKGLEVPGLVKSKSLESFAKLIDFQNFDQNHMTKKQVINQLLFSAVGLNLSFIIWGIVQERMLTQPYSGGEYFSSSYGLVFLNRLGGFIISFVLLYIFQPPNTSAVVYEYSFPSVSNMLSSWCQYEALKYVSFPTQMLFKCFKLVPIMLMGMFLGNKTYPSYDYVVAILIGFGIAMFTTGTEDMEFGTNGVGTPETWSGTICGLILLVFFLVFDSFTGQWQSRMFNKYQDLSPFHMMFAVNTFSMIFSFITLVHTKELETFAAFVLRHPDMHFHVIIFSICSTIGQLFIFQTIRNFGAVVFAIIMNARIVLSILLSCVIYSHEISSEGFFGLFIVFASVAYRIKRKMEGRELIRWRPDTSNHGAAWFNEVHEHIDM